LKEKKMNNKKVLFGVFSFILALSLLLAACAPAAAPTTAPAAPAAKGHHIALVQFLKGHPVHRIMQLGFHEGCVALKYDCELLLTDSTNGAEMIPLAEQALAEPVDGIVFYAYDKSFFPTIAKFKAKGIPVVTPHFTSFDQTESGLTAVVGADVAAYGKAVADAMGEKIGGKGSVAVTEGGFNETENLAATSFKDEMTAKYPNVKVLPAQEEGFDQAGAIAKAEAIIAGNPDLVGAFSTTGSGPTTWSTAASDTNKKDLVIISMDYTRPNLDLVKAGKVYGLVAQPLYDEFYQAVTLVGQAIDGKPVQYRNLLAAPVIFLKDLDSYYAFNDRAEAGISGVTPPQTPVPAPTAKP
jgi:ribose transport system substrate-binding protein